MKQILFFALGIALINISTFVTFTVAATNECGGIFAQSKNEANPLSDNLYERLGIPSNASQEEINKAGLQAMRKYNGDTSGGNMREGDSAAFTKVLEAYQTLRNPGKRAEYDRRISPKKNTNEKNDVKKNTKDNPYFSDFNRSMKTLHITLSVQAAVTNWNTSVNQLLGEQYNPRLKCSYTHGYLEIKEEGEYVNSEWHMKRYKKARVYYDDIYKQIKEIMKDKPPEFAYFTLLNNIINKRIPNFEQLKDLENEDGSRPTESFFNFLALSTLLTENYVSLPRDLIVSKPNLVEAVEKILAKYTPWKLEDFLTNSK